MSKTTPEEAKVLADKYSAKISEYSQSLLLITTTQLAALIDEVRGVDAEPVAWTPGPNEFKDWCSRWFGPDSDDDYLAKAVFNLPLMAQKFENSARPAPSQPAAPVGFGRTYGGCHHCGSSNCVAMQCCMPDGKPGAAPVELPVVSGVEVQPATVTITKAGWQYLAVGGVPVKSVYGKSNELEKLRDQINAAIAAGRKAS